MRQRGYRFCGATLASGIDLPLLAPTAPDGAACVISLGAVHGRRASAPRWFHHWRIGRQRPFLSFARCDEGYLLRFPGLADFLVSDDGACVRAEAARPLPGDTLQHLLVDQVLPLALSRSGRTLLHASAVHVPGVGALAFAGPSGRGKSTLAAALASRGSGVLSDDCLSVEQDDSGIRVHPAYGGLRLWPDARSRLMPDGLARNRVAHYTRKRRVNGGALRFHPDAAPLRALFVVSARAMAGPAATIRRCRPAAAVMRLVRCTYVLDIEDRAQLARTFDALATIVGSVPVMHLRIRDGHRWLPAACDAILRRAGQLEATSIAAAARGRTVPAPAAHVAPRVSPLEPRRRVNSHRP